ncbi:unnamed protein product [Effrenium voratum]|nr:unnamed protein product [Effrenium voratum]
MTHMRSLRYWRALRHAGCLSALRPHASCSRECRLPFRAGPAAGPYQGTLGARSVGLAMLARQRVRSQAFKFFFRKEKWKGTTGYFVGIAIIIVGWPFVGFLTEMYGIWKLFAAFLPNVLASLKMTVPGAATVLNMWPLSSLCNLINDQRRLPV